MSLNPWCSGHRASGAGELQQGMWRERVTVMAGKQKTSTPVYVSMHACLYLCKVLTDTMVLPQGKTELTLTETDQYPRF